MIKWEPEASTVSAISVSLEASERRLWSLESGGRPGKEKSKLLCMSYSKIELK